MDTTTDAITEWLTSPPLVNVKDPLSWWTAMARTGHPLASMALDFLSASGRFNLFSANSGIIFLSLKLHPRMLNEHFHMAA